MTGSKKLMDGLDIAAAALLKRHFPMDDQGNPVQSNLTDPEIQIKAFTACVNWYGPRTKLGGNDEGKTNEFTKLRDKLHGHRKSKRKAGDGEAEAGAANGALSADIPTEGSA